MRRYYCQYNDNSCLCNVIVVVIRCYCYPLSSRSDDGASGVFQSANVSAPVPLVADISRLADFDARKRHLRLAKFKRDYQLARRTRRRFLERDMV